MKLPRKTKKIVKKVISQINEIADGYKAFSDDDQCKGLALCYDDCLDIIEDNFKMSGKTIFIKKS